MLNNMTTRTKTYQQQIQEYWDDNNGEFWVHFPEHDTSDIHITKASDSLNGISLAECGDVKRGCWSALVTMEQVRHVICKDCLIAVGEGQQ